MTQRKISSILSKVTDCRKAGCHTEALILLYQLNTGIVRHILDVCAGGPVAGDEKIGMVARRLLKEIALNAGTKAVINKKTFRLVITWLGKMEDFFRQLKQGNGVNPRELFSESEKIFGILNISLNKLYSRSIV